MTLVSQRKRRWWRNLRGGAEVLVRIRGRDLHGRGDVIEDDRRAIATSLHAVYPMLTRARVEQMRPAFVAIRVTLAADPG